MPNWDDLDPEEAARRTRAREWYAKKYPLTTDDPYGAKRLNSSKAQTPAGIQRACNRVMCELGLGEPTDDQGSEQSEERLEPQEIDRNAYHRPVARQLPPYETRSRRKPGWTDCRFVLPRPILEGLNFLVRSMADQENSQRAQEPRGQRRRYPRTKNFYVTEALNALLADYGLSQFCVDEEDEESSPRRVRRFSVSE
jgi:hypothetical protein